MKMGIMTRDQDGWCSSKLQEAMKKQNITPICFGYRPIIGRINYTPEASVNEINLGKDIDAMITRPIGRSSLEEILFRMNLLHRLERLGLLIINPPLSIERAVDKYNSLTLFKFPGIVQLCQISVQNLRFLTNFFYK